MIGTPNKIPGLKYAPIEPPDPGQLPDSQIPGLSERIAEIAKEPWAKDDPVRMNAAIKAARQGANIRWTDSQRELRLHQEQMKAQGDAVDDSYMKRMYPARQTPRAFRRYNKTNGSICTLMFAGRSSVLWSGRTK
jgi:hypothetical protein